MTHDILFAQAFRGGHVESCYYGAIAVVDSTQKVVFAAGDITTPVFPRSTVKALQALPFVAEGAADRFSFPEEALALACASHQGEPAHIATVSDILTRLGLDHNALECGSHWPLDTTATHTLVAAGKKASALHNCCSGKHAGLISLACALHHNFQGYTHPDHPVIQRVARTLAHITQTPHTETNLGIDGCSLPTWAIPLTALALAFARFATGTYLPDDYATAATRLRTAMSRHPFMVAGSHQFDTLILQELAPRVLTKMGAEGVMTIALPEQGLGIALKCRSGHIQATEAAAAAMIQRFGKIENPILTHFMARKLKNWNGQEVGELLVARDLQAKTSLPPITIR